MDVDDFFFRGKLKKEITERILQHLQAVGLVGNFSCYLVGDIPAFRATNSTPFQLVVCLDQDANKFNEEVGKYLTSILIPGLARKCEFVFQPGVLNLDDHKAVFDVKHGVWFKGEPQARKPITAQVIRDTETGHNWQIGNNGKINTRWKTPIRQSPETVTAEANVPEGTDDIEFEKTLREHFKGFLRLEFPQTEPGKVNITTYPDLFPQLQQVLARYWELAGTQRERPISTPSYERSGEATFDVTLPTKITRDVFEGWLTQNGAPAFVADDIASKQVQVTCYKQDLDRLLELSGEFLAQFQAEKEPARPKPPVALPGKVKPTTFEDLPIRQDMAEVKVLIGSIPAKSLNAIIADYGGTIDRQNRGWYTVEIPRDRAGDFENELRLIAPEVRLASRRYASSFIRDVQFKDLPKPVQKDVQQFVPEIKPDTHLVCYGMVVSELLPKADPHNLELAQEHVKGISKKKLDEEIYEKSDEKYFLLMNDRLIDGHHFLAKCEKARVTRSLKVLDLTPTRFQKRKAQGGDQWWLDPSGKLIPVGDHKQWAINSGLLPKTGTVPIYDFMASIGYLRVARDFGPRPRVWVSGAAPNRAQLATMEHYGIGHEEKVVLELPNGSERVLYQPPNWRGAEARQIWIGIVDSYDSVSAKKITFDPKTAEETPTHAGLGFVQGARWRFVVGSNVIFWWGNPTDGEKIAVENFLTKKGLEIQGGHRILNDIKSSTWVDQEISEGYRGIPKKYRADLKQDVYEAVGEASMCWDPQPSTEVFDSTAASGVAERLLTKLSERSSQRQLFVVRYPNEEAYLRIPQGDRKPYSVPTPEQATRFNSRSEATQAKDRSMWQSAIVTPLGLKRIAGDLPLGDTWIGVAPQDGSRIRAIRDDGEQIEHEDVLAFGYSDGRWRYEAGVITWSNQPTKAMKWAVEAFLEKKTGQADFKHRGFLGTQIDEEREACTQLSEREGQIHSTKLWLDTGGNFIHANSHEQKAGEILGYSADRLDEVTKDGAEPLYTELYKKGWVRVATEGYFAYAEGLSLSVSQRKALKQYSESNYLHVTFENANTLTARTLFDFRDLKREGSVKLSDRIEGPLRIAKLLPGYETADMGFTDEGIGIIFVTESPTTHSPRINYFLFPQHQLEAFEQSGLSPEQWFTQNPPALVQKLHIDTAEGHDTLTREKVIEPSQLDTELSSLSGTLRDRIAIPYNRVQQGLTKLLSNIPQYA